MSQDRLLRWGQAQLEQEGLPPQEATWLLEWALGVSSLLQAEQNVGIRAAEAFRSAIAQRRARIPLQHVTGEMYFRYLRLHAGPGVFSVRPETETLTDLALAALPDGSQKVVDLCAGSGAIGLSIAAERSNSDVVLVELSARAAKYLRRNVESTALAEGSMVGVAVEDAVSALPGQEGMFDLVVSNPPYIGVADAPTQPEAQADPEMALFGGGEDGLVTPRGVVQRSAQLLKPGGTMVMEIGSTQGKALAEHALAVGFASVTVEPDLTGSPRFLVARMRTGPAQAVRDGSLIVIPTDTVYGIGADPYSGESVSRLLHAKGRGEQKPPPILGASTEELFQIADFRTAEEETLARTLADKFWPGPLTLVVHTGANPGLGRGASLGWDTAPVGGTVALRVPGHQLALEILRQTGPLAVTSANLTGAPPAQNVEEARATFGDRVALYFEGEPGGPPSTIVDCTSGSPRVVRLGAISPERIREALLGPSDAEVDASTEVGPAEGGVVGEGEPG